MIKQIYQQRYGKIIIAGMALILLYFGVSGYGAVRNWHTNHKWMATEEFAEDYQANPSEYYTYDNDGNETSHLYTLEEYVEQESYFWFQYLDNTASSSGNIQEFKKMMAPENFDSNTITYGRYGPDMGHVVIGLIALCGFLFFFIDQKTAFNRFLFSLPVSRKQLFIGKLTYLGLPLLGAFLVGSLLYVVILQGGIPQPYMNASWGQLLASVFSSLCTCVFAFGISVFAGTMLGNIVFGPLCYLLLMFSGAQLPTVVSNITILIDMIRGNHLNQEFMNDFSSARIYTWEISKTSSYWQASVGMVLISSLLIYWAYRKYQVLSLENDGEFVLFPESRWPVWGLMVVYILVMLTFGLTNVWYSYLYANTVPDIDWGYSLKDAVLATIFQLIIAVGISTVLVFFRRIRKCLREKWEAHLMKKSLKGGA